MRMYSILALSAMAYNKQQQSDSASLLHSEVWSIHKLSNDSAGARTIASIAINNGLELTCYRVSRLMRQLGLVSCQLRQHSYRKSTAEHVCIPNTLSREFNVHAPNQI